MAMTQYVEINHHLEHRADSDLRSLASQINASSRRNRTRFHERGTVLFAEGDRPRGVYILRKGTAAVSVCSSEGRVIILRLAHAGEMLGLSCVLGNSFHDTTVRTLSPCCIDFISRDELIAFSESNQAGASALLRVLSRELTQLTERTRSLLLPQTASGRLASLLLDCAGESTRIEKLFTHDEIAQMIGSSRETVTRLFTILRARKIIRTTPDSVVITDRRALEDILESNDQIVPLMRAARSKV